MVGGKREIYEQCLPIFRAVAKNIFHVGPTGHGNIVKLINNFLGQLANAGLAEVLPLGACRRKNLLREQIPSPGLSRYSV